MVIADIIRVLEQVAPPSLQESYDNSGLLIGDREVEVKGVLIALDCIEATVQEAMEKKCNVVIAHHPIVFSGLKRFNGANYVQRTVELAIKNDIAIYAIHTNLDNVYHRGVNSKIAEKIGLKNTQILSPKRGGIYKLITYAPLEHADDIRNALFAAGAGKIGNYSECSFASAGQGTFMGNHDANPYVGKRGERHSENEAKIEVNLRDYQQAAVLNSLKKAHPYEEVAYEIHPTLNADQHIGSGMVGELPTALSPSDFLHHLKNSMELEAIRYTNFDKPIKRVALCGGSGQFLLNAAKSCSADAYVSADFKYHEYFDAEDKIMICDIGHYESEKYTIDLLFDILTEKFSNFAVLKTAGVTNPVKYFL